MTSKLTKKKNIKKKLARDKLNEEFRESERMKKNATYGLEVRV